VTQLAGPVIAEASRVGLKVSSLTQILILPLGAGTDYGPFLVFRVREELRAGLAPRDAITQALTKVGESIMFSAGTVIAALLTLVLALLAIFGRAASGPRTPPGAPDGSVGGAARPAASSPIPPPPSPSA
jgi:uncharacterized membrane protein YdfJ with MMPL/SSD domain